MSKSEKGECKYKELLVSEREEKSWKKEPNITNNSLKHWIKNLIKNSLETLN